MTGIALIGPVEPPALHVMTFNIRRRVPHLTRLSPDLWDHRRWLLRILLRTESPTVLSTQEVLPDQAEWVLDSLGDHYRSVGRGRGAGGTGEGTPIVYDARRLRLIDWTQLALSDTPQRPGSRSWGNLFPRTVVSAHFTDRATGARFRVLNTHLDPLSGTSRLQAAHMLRRMVGQQDEAVVLTGDFNTDVGTRPYRELTAGGRLRDTWTSAQCRLTEQWGTLSNYRTPQVGGRRIDWILVDSGADVKSMGINATRFDGAAASDHEPVQAVLTLPLRDAPEAAAPIATAREQEGR